MSSPGRWQDYAFGGVRIKAGKFKIGVVEGDLETNQDADRIVKSWRKSSSDKYRSDLPLRRFYGA